MTPTLKEELNALSADISLLIERLLAVKEAEQNEIDAMGEELQEGVPGRLSEKAIAEMDNVELKLQEAIDALAKAAQE
jgi:hypothetical protein